MTFIRGCCWCGFFVCFLQVSCFAEDDKDPWQVLNKEAAALYQDQDFAASMEKAREALKFAQEHYAPDHPTVAKSLNNLAVLHVALGKHAQAMPLYERALDLEREIYGDVSPEIVDTLYNIGKLYYLQGKYSRTSELFQQVLEITRQLFGEGDIRVVGALENLAALYMEMGLEAEAQEYFEQARGVYKGGRRPR